ncbi:MAG: protein kinase [Planctomycetes bacterium]|nr:protein kinase [Planctomycetota bacterium]
MSRLEDYDLVRVLAKGGMGVVHEAVERATGRRVALKRILGAGGDLEAVDRFVVEGRAVARLDHPGVVRVHTLGRAPGGPFLVMDLVTGESLQRRLDRGGPLPPAEAVTLAAEVADALAHAHAQGVLHRDLKPANVLVDEAGRARLIDFGLAKLQAGAGSLGHLTRTGEVLGTPAFMAPEQADGRPVDARTDVYGLGATLYALLAGRPPFDGVSALAVLHAVLTAAPTPPSRLRPGLDPALERLVLACLAKDPAARPPSMDALRAALARGGQAAPRRRAAPAVVLGLSALLGAVAALAAWPAARPPVDASRVEAPPVDPPPPPPPPEDPAVGLLAALEAATTPAEAVRVARALMLADAHAAVAAALEEKVGHLPPDVELHLALRRARAGAGALGAALEPPPGDDGPKEAWVAHARALVAAGRRHAAREALSSGPLADVAHEDSAVLVARVEARGPGGRGDDDVRALRGALHWEPWPEGVFASALCHLDAGSLESAARLLEQLHALPRDPTTTLLAPRLAAALHLRRQRPADARAALDQALKLDPICVDALVERGALLINAGAPGAAEADLSAALRLDPLEVRAWEARAALRLAKGEFAGARSDALRAAALRGGREGRVRVVGHVEALLHMGQPAAALEAVEAALPEWGSLALRRLRGDALLSVGERERARDDFVAVLEAAGPGDVLEYAHAALQLGLSDWGGRLVDRLEGEHADEDVDWLEAAQALEGGGQHEAALRAADHAVERGVAGGRRARAQALTLLGRHREALADWEAVLAASPDDGVALSGRSGARWSLGDLDGALQDADRAVALASADGARAALLAERSRLHEARGDLDLALRDVAEAHRLLPLDGRAERVRSLEARLRAR